MTVFQASVRLQSVKPSPTLMLVQKAQELTAQGQDIVSLSAGEPDFPTPEWVCDAAINAIRSGQTRYTPVGGTPALKQAIITKFKRDNGLTYAPSEVMASTGGKQVIFNALLATLNQGDEVIIPAPFWVSYPDMVFAADGTPVIVVCDEDADFKLTPKALEAAITPRTRWVILNGPSNPTGALYTRAELLALGEVLLRNPHVWILSDDIYEHLLFDGHRFETIAAIIPALKDRTLTMNGVSKSYSMTGWRLGYAGGPSGLIKAMTDLQSHSTSNPCSISQAAAVAAINGPQDFLDEWRAAFQMRRDLMVACLRTMRGITCRVPEGAFYLYPSCAGLMGLRTPKGHVLTSDQDVATYLLEDAGVAVVPGSAFGLGPYLRLSIATDIESLTKAADRMSIAFDKLSAA